MVSELSGDFVTQSCLGLVADLSIYKLAMLCWQDKSFEHVKTPFNFDVFWHEM